jgi:hypothetical protein
VASPASARKKR